MLLLLDANAALVMAGVGFLLICAEFCLPGWVLPGVSGGVFLVCGAYRLALFDAGGFVAAALALTICIGMAAGYGWLPEWTGWCALACVPWLCRALLPGAIHWWAAGVAAIGPSVAFALLRIAARAVGNKTLLQ